MKMKRDSYQKCGIISLLNEFYIGMVLSTRFHKKILLLMKSRQSWPYCTRFGIFVIEIALYTLPIFVATLFVETAHIWLNKYIYELYAIFYGQKFPLGYIF